MCFFFFKQKTAYEMRISDWRSDVCSSDLAAAEAGQRRIAAYYPVARDENRNGVAADSLGGRPHRFRPADGQSQVAIAAGGAERQAQQGQTGRASCRERGGQYV